MAVDLSVFERQKTVLDQQQLQEAFNQKKQMMKLQELATVAELQKAMQPKEFDIGKVGEQAFIKASQGLPLSPIEASSLQYLDAKTPTTTFNPVTGGREEKPSLLQRAGVSMNQTQAIPAQNQPKLTQEQNKQVIDIFEGGTPAQPVNLTTPSPQDSYKSAMDDELKSAAGNPKLQQTIREKYVTTPEQIFTRENTLRDEFDAQTKTYKTIKSAFDKIQNTSDNAAGDLSLLYQYNKLLDPESVVRESEFATVASSGSLGQRIQGAAQKIATGERLTPEQRTQFKAESQNILNSQGESYGATKNRYEDISKRNRVNPANVIPDYNPNQTDYKSKYGLK